MGEAGTVHAKFQDALKRANFKAAWMLAYELPFVPLDEALELTLLAAKVESPEFAGAARKWLSRLFAEVDVPLETGSIATQLVADVAAGQLAPSQALMPLRRAAEGKRLG